MDKKRAGYIEMDESTSLDANQKKNSSWCSRTEKQLSLFVVVTLVVVILMAVFLVLQRIQIDKLNKVCSSPDCVEISGSMLSQMDLALNPCTDFYEYACARGLRDPDMVPPDKTRWGIFDKVSQRNQARLKKLLDGLNGTYKGVHSTALEKTKIMYDSCMNLTQREDIGTDPLLAVIRKLGSWPATDDDVSGQWDPKTWDMEKNAARALTLGSAVFLRVYVTADDKNSSNQVICFDQGATSFKDQAAYSGNDTAKYHNAFLVFFTKIVALLGGDPERAAELGDKLWNFEANLSSIEDLPENRTDPSFLYHPRMFSEVDDLLGPSFNLRKFVSLAFGEDIPRDENVILYGKNYVEQLGEILEATDDETLATYLVWQQVHMLIGVMPAAFRLASLELSSTLYGVQSTSPLWQECVARAGNVGFALGALFVNATFTPDDKLNAERLISGIRAAFKENLPGLNWMDPVTKQRALEKSEAVIQKIGYPHFIEDPEKLDEYYQDLNLTENDDFHNVINSRKFSFRQNVDQRHKPTDRKEWDMVPSTVNAYYNPSGNEIVFPAGILQKPFYESIYPKALLYGAIGMVMAHELTHGFDNSGRKFDGDGNLRNWWVNSSATAFQEKAQCLVEQYSEYTIYGANLNGVTTLGENIADNGGMKLCYAAYHNRLGAGGSADPLLPGLNMTGDQLFFLSFAQMWCSYYSPQYAQVAVRTDVHSNPKYRVTGVLRNFPEFSEAYSCPVGSPMNPAHKCSVW